MEPARHVLKKLFLLTGVSSDRGVWAVSRAGVFDNSAQLGRTHKWPPTNLTHDKGTTQDNSRGGC